MPVQTSILKHAFCFPITQPSGVYMNFEHFNIRLSSCNKLVISNILKHIDRIIQTETILEQMLDGLHPNIH